MLNLPYNVNTKGEVVAKDGRGELCAVYMMVEHGLRISLGVYTRSVFMLPVCAMVRWF